MTMKTSHLNSLFVFACAAAIAGCGGGGSSSSSTVVATPAPAASVPAPSGAPSPAPAASTPVATLSAGPNPTVTAADCPLFAASTVSPPAGSGADAQAVAAVLSSVDKNAYGLFSRLPVTLMWWIRSAGQAVDEGSIGAAVHETTHAIDNALRFTCSTDGLARYFVDGQAHATGLMIGGTSNYSIVSETYPAPLKVSRASRFDVYVSGAAKASANDFSVLVDELTSYSTGAAFEVNLLSSRTYWYLSVAGDLNAGGMADFMLFELAYLQAARLNHPAAYASIQSQGQTLAYLQFSWSRAEKILAAMYPYSVSAGGAQLVPVDVLKAVYDPVFLAELDRLGITHKVAADWSATYLK